MSLHSFLSLTPSFFFSFIIENLTALVYTHPSSHCHARIAGRPVLMMPTMAVSGLLGATFGLALGWQMSFGRLTGLNENAREVAMYGPESSDINNKSS